MILFRSTDLWDDRAFGNPGAFSVDRLSAPGPFAPLSWPAARAADARWVVPYRAPAPRCVAG